MIPKSDPHQDSQGFQKGILTNTHRDLKKGSSPTLTGMPKGILTNAHRNPKKVSSATLTGIPKRGPHQRSQGSQKGIFNNAYRDPQAAVPKQGMAVYIQYPTRIGIVTGTGIVPGLTIFAGTGINRYRDWRQNQVCRDSTGIDFSSPGCHRDLICCIIFGTTT